MPAVGPLRYVVKSTGPPAPITRIALPHEQTATTRTPEAVLRDVFGFDEFRPGQREVIDAVLAGKALAPLARSKQPGKSWVEVRV